jgi:hypothetical protein
MRDLEGHFLGLLMTHMPHTIPELWDDFPDTISVLYNGELYVDDSSRPGYAFCATHYHRYNRYSEDVSAESPFPHYVTDIDTRELVHHLGCIQIISKELMWSGEIMGSVFPENLKRSQGIQRSSYFSLVPFKVP